MTPTFSTSSESPDDMTDFDYVPPKKQKIESSSSSKKVNIMSELVVGALARAKISNFNAAVVLSAVAQKLGHDVEKLALSKESIRIARNATTEAMYYEMHQSFSPDIPLIVHWDLVKLPDTTNVVGTIRNIERLVVAVSGKNTTKLLAIVKLDDATSKPQVEQIFNTLSDWGVLRNIIGLSFHTTASNTGIINGVCTLLQQKFNKYLLTFACQHHVFEIIIGEVFTKLIEKTSSGPDIAIFQRFRNQWNKIDHTIYQSGTEDKEVMNAFEHDKYNLIYYIKQQLERNINRSDYKEFLKLGLLLLGETEVCGKQITIKQPGSVSRARWMSKILYSLKIFLLRHQFKLNSKLYNALVFYNLYCIKYFN